MSVLARTLAASQCASANARVCIRSAVPTDRAFVMSLVPRLVELGLPAWRDPRKLLAAYVEVIGSILRPQEAQGRSQRSDAALLIAEDAHATPLGFTLLVAATDCYTHERHGHVAQIVVADDRQELPAGLALIDAAGAWARSRGYRLLTMSEFWSDYPARALCQQLGFAEEIVKYRKVVR